MPVTMYDCDFGDCFVIEAEHVDIPLYVDFGVHNRSTVLKTPALETRYDDIIARMPEKKDLLKVVTGTKWAQG